MEEGSRIANLWGSIPKGVRNNPFLVGAGVLGGIGVNHLIGNPFGGLVDAITFGGTNLRANDPIQTPSLPYAVVQERGYIPQKYQLSEEDQAKALDNLQRKIALDLITTHALEGISNG